MSDADAIEHSRAKYARLEGDGRDSDSDQPKEEQDYKSKHTLDSDEEEDVKYKKLDIDKVEGQEGAEVEFDGNTKITPFNMKEDLEDGHFDTDGNFIFDKKERDINDAWLDNIDWAHIKKAAGDQWQKTGEEEEEDWTVGAMGEGELKGVYDKIMTFLQPNETIEKAIKRIGKQKLSAAEERKRRWAAKKAGEQYVDDASVQVKELTGLADALVSKGKMEAYQLTKEKIQILIHKLTGQAVDNVDIFADAPSTSVKESSAEEVDKEDEVMWEYKLSEGEESEIHGPKTSEEMLKMQSEGRFEKGGWARKKGTQAFYTVARLDFELYT